MTMPLAAETTAPSAARRAPAGGFGRHFDRTLASWPDDAQVYSAADPDTLARAVRAHKAGDAFAQAALTLALDADARSEHHAQLLLGLAGVDVLGRRFRDIGRRR